MEFSEDKTDKDEEEDFNSANVKGVNHLLRCFAIYNVEIQASGSKKQVVAECGFSPGWRSPDLDSLWVYPLFGVSLFLRSYNLTTPLYLRFFFFSKRHSLLDTLVPQMQSNLFLNIFHGQFISLSDIAF